jgi:hypothetical protein
VRTRAVVAALAALALSGCADETTNDPDNPSPAYKLASIDNGSPVDADDPAVARFDRELDALQRHCIDRRIRLSDMTVKAQELLADANVDESLLSIITNVRRSIPAELRNHRCADVFAAYVTLRKGS